MLSNSSAKLSFGSLLSGNALWYSSRAQEALILVVVLVPPHESQAAPPARMRKGGKS